jgi:general secretion pathway protein L
MAEAIALRLEDTEARKLSWRSLGRNLSSISFAGEGSPEEAADLLKGQRLHVIVPTEKLLLTQVEIPTKNTQRLLQAVPYTLENDLTEEVDQLHFALGNRNPNQSTPVAVINEKSLLGWLDNIVSMGTQPLGFFPDTLCLPLIPSHWSIYLEPERALVRTGQSAGFSTEPENLQTLLEIALSEAPTPPEQMDIWVASNFDQPSALLLELEVLGIRLETVSDQAELTGLLADNLDAKQTLNLLQGKYKQVDRTTIQWRRWLPAIVVLGLLLVSNLALTLVEYMQYSGENQRLKAEIQQVFREALPETKRLVDPKVQMQQALRALNAAPQSGRHNFLKLLSGGAPAIMQSPGGEIENLSFRDGQLDIKLTINELQSLEKIKAAIEAKQFSVEIRSANATGKQVSAHLRISGEGS